MVLTRLDYGSTTLTGLPDQLLHKLQFVLNAAARLVCLGLKYNHITPLLRDLHWLPFLERITYRLAVLACRRQHGLAPLYLADELHRMADATRVSGCIPHRRALRCYTYTDEALDSR